MVEIQSATAEIRRRKKRRKKKKEEERRRKKKKETTGRKYNGPHIGRP